MVAGCHLRKKKRKKKKRNKTKNALSLVSMVIQLGYIEGAMKTQGARSTR